MILFQPVFKNRDYSDRLLKINCDMDVQSMTWKAVGGCHTARLFAKNTTLINLWEFIEYLRCPVEIKDPYSNPIWWGMVNVVTVNTGKIQFGVSLDDMSNNMWAWWSAPKGSGAHNTAVFNDLDSQAEYGIKSLALSINASNKAHAEGYVQRMLADRRYPVPKMDVSSGTVGATLECTGWWNTLAWRYWVKKAGGNVDTATQIAAIVAQFTAESPARLTACYLDGATGSPMTSGISISQTRDGKQLAQVEIEDMMKSGTSNNKRMLGYVDINRGVHIYEEPPSAASDNFITANGDFQTFEGTPLPAYMVGAGNYLRLKDVVPATADATRLSDPSKIFIDELEWTPSSVRITPKSIASDFDLFGVKGF